MDTLNDGLACRNPRLDGVQVEQGGEHAPVDRIQANLQRVKGALHSVIKQAGAGIPSGRHIQPLQVAHRRARHALIRAPIARNPDASPA